VSATNLVGHFFHAFTIESDGCHIVQSQGRVDTKVTENDYLVTYFDWIAVAESYSELRTLDQMRDYRFNPDSDTMNFAWEHRGLSASNDRHWSRHIES
jgi:hypothetical protein